MRKWGRYLVVLLLALAGGCGRKPAAIPSETVVSTFSISDRKGTPAPDELVVRPNERIELFISFNPKTPDSTPFAPRPVHPPDYWRIKASLTDSSGKRTPLAFGDEFASSDWVPSEAVIENRVIDSKVTTMISSRPLADWHKTWPPKSAPKEQRHYWTWLPAPEEPGAYSLDLIFYPTADQEDILDGSELGPGVHVHRLTIRTEGPALEVPRPVGRERSPYYHPK